MFAVRGSARISRARAPNKKHLPRRKTWLAPGKCPEWCWRTRFLRIYHRLQNVAGAQRFAVFLMQKTLRQACFGHAISQRAKRKHLPISGLQNFARAGCKTHNQIRMSLSLCYVFRCWASRPPRITFEYVMFKFMLCFPLLG